MSTPAPGRLVLIPNTLDLGAAQAVPLSHVLPQAAIERAAGLRHWVVENAKSARAFLKRVGEVAPLVLPLQQLDIRELPRQAKGVQRSASSQALQAREEQQALRSLLTPALEGADIGLLSEAGLPAVADPGSDLVAQAHQLGLAVEPWSGPSSLMLALAVSGLGGQNFAFVGYLPQDAAARAVRIRELEAVSRRSGQTQIAIETPYRNAALLQALVDTLQPSTRLCVASGITLPGAWNRSDTVAEWRQGPAATLHSHTPAVFAWLA